MSKLILDDIRAQPFNEARIAKELADYDWGQSNADVKPSARIELPVFGKGGAAFSSAEYWAKRLGQGARIRSIELYEMANGSMWKAAIRYQTDKKRS